MNLSFLNRLFLLCETDNMAEVARKVGVPYNTMKNYSGKFKVMPSVEVLL
jgi:hypothetical protein